MRATIPVHDTSTRNPYRAVGQSKMSGRARAAWERGRASAAQRRWADAASAFDLAVKLNPADDLYRLNLADALLKMGQLSQALSQLRRTACVGDTSRLKASMEATILFRLEQHQDLIDLLEFVPVSELSHECCLMQGRSLGRVGRLVEAVGVLMTAVSKKPSEAMGHYYLGLSFNHLGLKREAAECFRTALLLGLGNYETGARDLLGFYERETCDWRSSAATLAAMRETAAGMDPDSALPMTAFAYVVFVDDPSLQKKAASICANHFIRSVAPLPPRTPVKRPRLRVGYVSADFHSHATSYLMAELFERHDRSRVEVFAYSHGPAEQSPIRQRLEAGCEHFLDVKDEHPRKVAERIHSDGIDILVDLKGFTKDALPEIFAAKPAPLQVSYLGFPGTTGAPYIDYVISDAHVTPLSAAEDFSEKIAHLPVCYQSNDGARPLPVAPTRASQGLPDNALVLCGFNQPYKISPEVFDLWCQVLNRLPNAVLWLLGWNDQAPPALRDEAIARGVDPSRLIFAPSVPQAHHLDRIACADIFLDTWPCNGHTTASDMLWAGVPVVTYSGKTFASRVAGSLLHAVGVPETICDSVEAYEAKVMELATHESIRLDIRHRVEQARHTSPLFSGERIARDIEALYESMWARQLAGLAPAHLPAVCSSAH